jgi:hypothetical protein
VCGEVEWTEKEVILPTSMYYPSINLEELRKRDKISVSILYVCYLIIALPFYSVEDYTEGNFRKLEVASI